MPATKTSLSHPIRVDWLPTPWPGKVGLTFAPGKRDPYSPNGPWDRDLAADLARLRNAYEVTHLVTLMEDHELELLHNSALRAEAANAGLQPHRLPIVDVSVPQDRAAVLRLVLDITAWAQQGNNVVIHCRGGLGRSGTIGGCVLRAAGFDGESALAALAEARAPNCPETTEQRNYVRSFGFPTLAPQVSGTVLRAAGGLLPRVAGAVLGAAIGDALGHPTEFFSYPALEAKYGPGGAKQYELWWERDGKRFAPYTDDTQMAEIVLRALLQHGTAPAAFEATMETIGKGFALWSHKPQGGHRAPGTTCMAGAAQLLRGVPWREAGVRDGGGCGSVMRAYPFGLVLGHDIARAEHWAVEHSRMTHQAPMALAACAAMAVGMAAEMSAVSPSSALAAMVEAAGRYDTATAKLAETALKDASNQANPIEVLTELQGWNAQEAIAAAMFVVARHPGDIRAALLEGANASGDSDSIATLAGALLGARHGIAALPEDWVRDVERSDELLELALEASVVAAMQD